MTYFELLSKANRLLDKGEITIGQRDEMTKPLWDEIRPKGEWNYIQADMCVCPFCGAMPHKLYKNYCAKCGAKMGGTT